MLTPSEIRAESVDITEELHTIGRQLRDGMQDSEVGHWAHDRKRLRARKEALKTRQAELLDLAVQHHPPEEQALARAKYLLELSQHRANRLWERCSALEDANKAAEARVAAGAERRREMTHILFALLTCEDDDLPDCVYERRMDNIIRRARTLVSAEKAAALASQRIAASGT